MRPPIAFHWFKDSIILIALALSACGGGSGLSFDDTSTLEAQGQVVDDQGVPLASATVTVVSDSSASGTDTRVTTDSEGRFRLNLDAATPAVIRVDKAGYAPGFRAAGSTQGNGAVGGRVVMLPVASTQTFDPTEDAVLRVPGSVSRVSVPANALVRTDGQPLSGAVTVALTPVDPSVDAARMPGLMVDASNGEPIESLGALGVTFTDASGAPLNLAAGQRATLRIAATPAAGATLPASFPLYHLNERTGTWVQEGSATLQTDPATGQSYYEGTVSHFSWWNADQVYTRTTVDYRTTVDGAACTVPDDLMVHAVGLDYNGLVHGINGQVFARASSRVALHLVNRQGELLDRLEVATSTAGVVSRVSRCLVLPPQVTLSGRVTVASGSLSNYRVQINSDARTLLTMAIGSDGRYSARVYGNQGEVRARLVSALNRGTPDTQVSANLGSSDVVMPDLSVSDTVGELSGCLQGWDRYRQRGMLVSLFQEDRPLGAARSLSSTDTRFSFEGVPLNSTVTLRLTPPDATLVERSVNVAMGNASVNQGSCIDLPEGPQARVQVNGSGLNRSFDASTSRAAPDAEIRAVQWDFGDGNTAQGSLNASSSHTYASAGSYTARLTLTDALGQQSSITVPVVVVTGNSSVSAWRQVASGELHTCYINANGGVACEGHDGYGQLGSGELFASIQPTAVVGLGSGVREVAAGYDFSCALTEGGAVYCWGGNGQSQLGPNTTERYSATPVRVTGLGEGVQSISAGHSHACAITQSGGVKCWGNNSHGQLGNEEVSNVPSPTPQDVVGLTEGIVTLGLGGNQSCAGTATGLYCWGYDPLYPDSYVRSSPHTLDGVSDGVVSVSAGSQHVCAVTRAGALKCWGLNTHGQLGNGGNPSSNDVVGASQGFASVSAGPDHTCAVTTQGITHCWGRNDLGQLGDGSTASRNTPAIATEQTGTALGVGARAYSSCVLRSNRSLQCWGWLEGYAPGG